MNDQDLKVLELLSRKAALNNQSFIATLLKDAADTLRYDLNEQYTTRILTQIIYN